ncbi:MAG: hypothetical protein ABFE02_04630 [Sulfuricella sp.]
MSDWRQHSWQVIQDAFEACMAQGTRDPDTIMKCVKAAYPFGPRKYHPYTVWLLCVREFSLKLPMMIEYWKVKKQM